MARSNLEIANSIIDQAIKKAEDKYQEAVNETLPRQLEYIPKTEEEDHYKRKLQECREWYNKNYKPYYDLEKYGKDRLAGMIRGWLDDNDKGLNSSIKNEAHGINSLAERIYISKYLRYLVALIEGRIPKPEARSKRLSLALAIAEEVVKEYPQTAKYYSIEGVTRGFFPFMDEDYKHLKQKQFLAHSEEAFKAILEEKLAALNSEIAERFNRLPDGGEDAYIGFLFSNTLKARFLEALFLSEEDEKGKVVSFAALFGYSPDKDTIIRKLEENLPEGIPAVEDGKWVFKGRSEKALIFALADVIKHRANEGKISIKKGISADEIAQAIASYFNVKLAKKEPGRARYKEGIRNKGSAYDYNEYRKHFLNRLK